MDELVNIISPDGVLNMASLIRTFLLMVGMDGVILAIYFVLRGSR